VPSPHKAVEWGREERPDAPVSEVVNSDTASVGVTIMRYFPSFRRSAVVTLATAATVIALALPAGATAPSGNAAAIRQYAAASIRVNKLPYFTIDTKSLYFLRYLSNGAWELDWGVPKTPAGFTRVDATEILASAHGKNVWEEITFSYACASNEVACFSTLTPIRFYLSKTATYWAELSGINYTPGCWNNAAKGTPWIKTDFSTIGDPTWYPGTSTKFATASFFDPAVTKGKTTTFTSTYEYLSDKAHVTEVDTLDDTTDIFTLTSLKIGATTVKGKKYPGYSFSQAFTVPTGTVKPPKTTHMC
jgi:hypothetical protein